MQVIAIIAEYNPFHNGHAYQIGQIRRMFPENCAIIAVMSGNLVQRGEFALASKYSRAKAAVLCGVDAVFELPSVYSCAPANLFAEAAVSIVAGLGGVDYLCFGSESSDLDLLRFAAQNSDIDLGGRSRGKNYPRSFYEAFKDLYGAEKARVFKGSNDILAVEYIKAIAKLKSPVAPLAIRRAGDDYITSASAIRQCVCRGDLGGLRAFMPGQSLDLLRGLIKSGKTADINNISAAIIAHISRLGAAEIARFADIHGGFERRIKAACGICDYADLIARLASKHATSSQVKRMVLNIFFGIAREEQKAPPGFTNLLCANSRGREYLNRIKKSAAVKIISKPARFADNTEYAKNIFIDNIYKLALADKRGEISAIKESPVIL